VRGREKGGRSGFGMILGALRGRVLPMRCENKDICCFVRKELAMVPLMSSGARRRFCKREKEGCARYMVRRMIMDGYTLPDEPAVDRIGGLLVDLHPGDTDSARELMGIMVR